jgi:uncharacterized protein (TIGR02246 family)
METLFLVPGLLCDAVIWRPQVQALAGGFDVRVPDLAGFDSIAAMAASVLADAPPRFSIAGHSMGARVALEVARVAPGRVQRLALLDTGVHPVNDGEPERRRVLTELSRTQGMTALAQAWLPPMVAPGNFTCALRATLVAMVERMSPEIHRGHIAALLGRPDARGDLARIAVPTLVGVGALDAWSPPAQNREIAEAIPGAAFVVFEGAGHMAPLEAPAAVTAALSEWMARGADAKDPVQRLLAEHACIQLVHRFAWANDANDHEALAALFTEDGSFARPTAPDTPVRGRAALQAFFRDRPARRTQHVMSNVVVDLVDAGHALVRSYITLHTGEGGRDLLAGRFEDRVVREADGQWRFSERRGSLTF